MITILNVCHLVYSLNEVVSMIKIGMTHSTFGQLDRSLLDPKFWIKDFTWTREGFCYTLNSSLRVGTDYEKDIIGFFANDKNAHQIIYIHDPQFFVINNNPMALSKKRFKVASNTFQYQRISLVKHVLLNHAKVPCEPRKDYSFRDCVRNSLADKVKCRLPWPSSTNPINKIPVCENLAEFLQFEKLYADVKDKSTTEIEDLTKCLRPCQYNEYKMVDGPTSISEKIEDARSAFLFWFVTTETLVQEQSFVYPWQSLVS